MQNRAIDSTCFNWLPAPEGQFALIVRAYVPEAPILDDSYRFPDVVRQ